MRGVAHPLRYSTLGYVTPRYVMDPLRYSTLGYVTPRYVMDPQRMCRYASAAHVPSACAEVAVGHCRQSVSPSVRLPPPAPPRHFIGI